MKTLRAWLAAILALVMVLGLAGCAKEPTPQELFAGAQEIDPAKYNSMEMEMQASVQGNGQTTELVLSTSVEYQGDLMHFYDMDVSVGASGISIAFTMEMWMDIAEDTMYAQVAIFGEDSGWMKMSDVYGDDFPGGSLMDMAGSMSDVNAAALEALVLEPREDGEDYVVTWTQDGEELSETFREMMGGFGMSDLTDGMYDDMQINSVGTESHFDAETRDLKYNRMEIDTTTSDGDVAISATVTYNEKNGDQELAIPQDVIDTAVDAAGLF